MREWLDRIHWPQAALLIATLASLGAFPILFLALVPERIVDKILGLPWMTIVTLGIPALIVALAPIASAFMRSVVAKREPDSKSPSSPPRSSRTSGHATLRAMAFVVLAGAFGLASCALLSGCGASALQSGAVGVTIALRAEEAVSAVVVADLDRRMDACPAAEPTSSADVIAAHNACVDRERASVADLTDALSAIELSIRAVGAGIATAAEVDAGQPIPAILLDTLREVLALWDRIEVALRAHGIDVPSEIGLVVAALGALVGPAS